MGEGVFEVRGDLRQFPEGAAVGLERDEDRVVAESALPPALPGYPALHAPFGGGLPAVGPHGDRHRDEPRPALLGPHLELELGQHLVDVGLIVGGLPGIARRPYPGGAAQGVHLDAGVLGNGRKARGLDQRPRLEAGVAEQGLLCLLDLPDARRPVDQLDPEVAGGENLPDLACLVGVGRGKHEGPRLSHG